jgi:hypothetical protein
LVEDEEVVRAIPGFEDLEAATMPGEDLETALREAPQRVAAATAQLVARYVKGRRVDDG